MSFKKLLFVCMGNSCSSPMAETIMQNLMVKTSLYWEVDSAALRNWNIGRRPHKRCLQVLREHGLRNDHFCRLLTVHDVSYFDYIIAINAHVHKELLLWAEANRITDTSNVIMLGLYGKNGKTLTNIDLSPTRKLKAFRSAYYQIKDCCKNLILSQHVSIVRYELPSSDDDSEPSKSNLEKPATSGDSLAIDRPQYKNVQQHASKCSVITQCLPSKCHKQELCKKCGQKFLATL